MLTDLCLASSNTGKIEEYKALLTDAAFEIHTQADFDISPPDETGLTFVENALLKARYTATRTQLPALADDSGLCVDVLGGAPGLYSARYAGAHASMSANIDKLLHDIAPYQHTPLSAYYVSVICFLPHPTHPHPFLAIETWHGEVIHKPRGLQRGYDSIFYLTDLQKTVGELSLTEKNILSNRGRAMKKLFHYFSRTY